MAIFSKSLLHAVLLLHALATALADKEWAGLKGTVSKDRKLTGFKQKRSSVSDSKIADSFEGAVYAMSNKVDGNTIVAYGRRADGTHSFIGEFSTYGLGGVFDGGEGLDPLISANSILITENKRFLLAVNAGSSSVSVLRINRDFSLRFTYRARTRCVGPNSIAYFDSIVYVTCVDADGVFTGEPDQKGLVTGFVLTPFGSLFRIRGSSRRLGNRPSDVHFSPDGKYLVVSSINAGSAALNDGNKEIVVYAVQNVLLSKQPVSSAASTEVGNAQNRNLPSAIGSEIVEQGGRQFVVVTEAREFQADGSPPAFPALQTGSVSTWELGNDGSLTPVNLDVLAGSSQSDGQRTACWLDFSIDRSYLWVSNALDSSISTYGFSLGQLTLANELEIVGNPPAADGPGNTDGFIDLKTSLDGRYVYQLYGLKGTIGVLRVANNGFSGSLTLVEELTGTLPMTNTQGIIAI